MPESNISRVTNTLNKNTLLNVNVKVKVMPKCLSVLINRLQSSHVCPCVYYNKCIITVRGKLTGSIQEKGSMITGITKYIGISVSKKSENAYGGYEYA